MGEVGEGERGCSGQRDHPLQSRGKRKHHCLRQAQEHGMIGPRKGSQRGQVEASDHEELGKPY